MQAQARWLALHMPRWQPGDHVDSADPEKDEGVAPQWLDDVGLDLEHRSAHRLGVKILGPDAHQRAPGTGEVHRPGIGSGSASTRPSGSRSIESRPSPSISTSIRFMVGEPMKPATKLDDRPVVELVGRADLLDPPALHDDDPVGQRHRLDLVVRDVDDRGRDPSGAAA